MGFHAGLFFADLPFIFEILEVAIPVVTLGVQRAGKIEQGSVPVAVVQPENAQQLVAPTIHCPVLERMACELSGLVPEIALHDGDHPRIRGRLMILRERLEHDHVRPPIRIALGSYRPVRSLIFQRPAGPLSYLGKKFRILQEKRKGHEPVEIVGTALPALARASQPAAVRSQVGPEFIEMAGQPRCLDFQLAAQPSPGFDRTQRQKIKRIGCQRSAVFEDRRRVRARARQGNRRDPRMRSHQCKA